MLKIMLELPDVLLYACMNAVVPLLALNLVREWKYLTQEGDRMRRPCTRSDAPSRRIKS